MEDHDRMADGLERELDDMERTSDRLGENIDEVRADWRRKQQDANVPGADQPDDDQLEEQPPPGEMERE
jgi:hypothetical protein